MSEKCSEPVDTIVDTVPATNFLWGTSRKYHQASTVLIFTVSE